MKNRKGFTIVELVIVIAVIAILAAVLIPTFSGVIQKANASAAQQQAASAEKIALSMSQNATLPTETAFVIYNPENVSTYYYEYVNNKLADGDKDSAKSMSLEGYTTALGSIIVSTDYFLGTDGKTVATQSAIVDATEKVKALIAKLVDMTGIASTNFTSGEKVAYTFTRNEDKTGYILTFQVYDADLPTAFTDAAKQVVNVFTSVDLTKDCIVFIPVYTENQNP